MIHTRVSQVPGVVFNESDGPFSKEDAVHALIRTEELGQGECAVIWDFRKSDAGQFDLKLLESVSELLRTRVLVPSRHRRAIIVRDSVSRQRVENTISKLRPPWPWIVVTEPQEALSWVGDT